MLKKTLIQHFSFCQFTVMKNLAEVTDEDSLIAPDPGGNCANWILGHIVWGRGLAHKLIGAEPPMPDKEVEMYRRGGDPIEKGTDVLYVDQLLAAFLSSQEVLKVALTGMTDEQFAAPKPEGMDSPGGDSIGEQLAALAFHEAYHAGQLGVIRRIMGKEDCLT